MTEHVSMILCYGTDKECLMEAKVDFDLEDRPIITEVHLRASPGHWVHSHAIRHVRTLEIERQARAQRDWRAGPLTVLQAEGLA